MPDGAWPVEPCRCVVLARHPETPQAAGWTRVLHNVLSRDPRPSLLGCASSRATSSSSPPAIGAASIALARHRWLPVRPALEALSTEDNGARLTAVIGPVAEPGGGLSSLVRSSEVLAAARAAPKVINDKSGGIESSYQLLEPMTASVEHMLQLIVVAVLLGDRLCDRWCNVCQRERE